MWLARKAASQFRESPAPPDAKRPGNSNTGAARRGLRFKGFIPCVNSLADSPSLAVKQHTLSCFSSSLPYTPLSFLSFSPPLSLPVLHQRWRRRLRQGDAIAGHSPGGSRGRSVGCLLPRRGRPGGDERGPGPGLEAQGRSGQPRAADRGVLPRGSPLALLGGKLFFVGQ